MSLTSLHYSRCSVNCIWLTRVCSYPSKPPT